MENAARNFISDKTSDRLIAAHDGSVALLFLWLMRNGELNESRAAADLCMTLAEVKNAYEKLCRMELDSDSTQKSEVKPLPAEELPEYTAQDISRRAKSDPGFTAVLNEAQRRLGRVLSTADIKTLFGIYDFLALPPDVIFMLLTYCIDSFKDKYGDGRMPSMRSIEKEAYFWANREILTIEQAEEFIENAADRRSMTGKVKAALGIQGRRLTATEEKYILSWIDMGFSQEAIEVAYDRTVTNTGSLKWNYMNKILLSWHEKGIHSADEIEEKDTRRPAANNTGNTPSSDELGRLRSIYKKVKNG